MMSELSNLSLLPERQSRVRCAHLSISVLTLVAALAPCLSAAAQTPAQQEPEVKILDGYLTHQSVDLGGHIAEHSGSDAMYATLVNIQSGPRILDYSLSMDAQDKAKATFFDHLSTTSFGYGGDPNNVTLLRIYKGRIYDFEGSFRRDRQYFDYNLLANPLIPPASVPFIPILDSPHLYNTVRRMTDVKLTLAPLSVVSTHFGYFQNVSEGPGFSTIHQGTEALLIQNWRHSTDVWNGGVDWKPVKGTTISFDEFITHYKGNTNWQLTGLNYQLSNGTPASLGINISSVWRTPCATPFNANGTVNPTCNAYLGYSRYAPVRTLFPSEQFHFQSTSVPNLSFNGRVLYMGTTSHLVNYNENFNGLDARAANRLELMTGSGNARRINLNADIGATWQISPTIALNDVYDLWYFRQPATSQFTNTNYAGSSLLLPPGAATTTKTTNYEALNQETHTNTVSAFWDVASRTRLSLGYRYRSRLITNADGDYIPIHENWGLFGAAVSPTPQLRVNFNLDLMYADNSFTRISPRQLQHYVIRSTYKPRTWATFSGTVNIFESRDNVQTVNHLEHNRDFSFAAAISPSERWSVDLDYSYNSVYSSTLECYASTPPPPTAGVGPSVCVAAGTPQTSTGYYNAPTQFGSIGFMFVPVKRVHFNAGYRMSAVNGAVDFINIRQVPGSLQSQWQTPYGHLVFELAPGWTWKADYNYYSYGEGTPIGPTLPRSFRGNVYTLGVGYVF